MARDDRIDVAARRVPAPAPQPAKTGVRRFLQMRDDRFGDEQKRLFLVALRKGESVLAACRLVGISNRTAYNHRQSDPEFAVHWELARRMARLPLELVAFERAVIGTAEPLSLGGGRTATRRRYSDSLLRLLLQGEHPRKYGRAAAAKADRKWLKKQVAKQVAEALATQPSESAPPAVRVVNPPINGKIVLPQREGVAAPASLTAKQCDFADDREPALRPPFSRPAPDLAAAPRSSCGAFEAWAG
jgi:hypothetical protein